MTMPRQKPGRSKQDYRTPENFIEAAKRRLGIKEFAWDLAADEINTQCGDRFFSEADNSLVQNWDTLDGWLWLNPPFSDIAPWARKCNESHAKIAFLVPASVGANWFRDYIDGHAQVLFLNGRLSFMETGELYPKDCILCLFGPEIIPGYEVWNWRK